jgi:glutaredoxin
VIKFLAGQIPAKKPMVARILMFTQPGCLSCEMMKVFLEARQIPFEERDITADLEARRAMTEQYDSCETPTLVVFLGASEEVIVGFDPDRLDHLLRAAPSSDAVTES